jgi:hypothetical protein
MEPDISVARITNCAEEIPVQKAVEARRDAAGEIPPTRSTAGLRLRVAISGCGYPEAGPGGNPPVGNCRPNKDETKSEAPDSVRAKVREPTPIRSGSRRDQ